MGAIGGTASTAGMTGWGSGIVLAETVGFNSTVGSTTGADGGWKLATGVEVSTLVLAVDATTGGCSFVVVVGDGIGLCSAICGVRENMRITMPAET